MFSLPKIHLIPTKSFDKNKWQVKSFSFRKKKQYIFSLQKIGSNFWGFLSHPFKLHRERLLRPQSYFLHLWFPGKDKNVVCLNSVKQVSCATFLILSLMYLNSIIFFVSSIVGNPVQNSKYIYNGVLL